MQGRIATHGRGIVQNRRLLTEYENHTHPSRRTMRPNCYTFGQCQCSECRVLHFDAYSWQSTPSTCVPLLTSSKPLSYGHVWRVGSSVLSPSPSWYACQCYARPRKSYHPF